MASRKRSSQAVYSILTVSLLLLLLIQPGMARDYSVGIVVTQCRESTRPGVPSSWAAEPGKAAANTLSLVQPLLAGPTAECLQFTTGQPLELPTRQAIQKRFAKLHDEVEKDDRVVLYLATALVRDAGGKAYLLTDDAVLGAGAGVGSGNAGKAARLGEPRPRDGLALAELGASVRKLTASQVLVVMDLCAIDEPIREAKLKEAFGEAATRSVLAWSADRDAYWEPQGKMTRLAGRLLDGLRGAADADADGHIRHAELIEYLAETATDTRHRLAVLGKNADWKHEFRPAHLDAIANRLADAVSQTLRSKGLAKEQISIREPTAAAGSSLVTPHAKILARRMAVALTERGFAVVTDRQQAVPITISGRLELRNKPDRLVVNLETTSGDKRLGTVRDTMLATGDLADLAFPTALRVSSHGREAASLVGLRGARVEAIDDDIPARHPHFTAYQNLPVALHFELCDSDGQNAERIQPVEVGGDCYLPVEKGKCFRILLKRQGPTPCAMLVLVDGGNVMSTVGLPEDARFAAPEEHLDRLNYFVLTEDRDYAIGEWMTLGTERKKDGPAAARRFIVADAPDAVGYRKPGAELGEIRILLYPARTTSAGERAAFSSGIGMAGGAASALPMTFVEWRADASAPHARLVYRYRQAADIPPMRPHSRRIKAESEHAYAGNGWRSKGHDFYGSRTVVLCLLEQSDHGEKDGAGGGASPRAVVIVGLVEIPM